MGYLHRIESGVLKKTVVIPQHTKLKKQYQKYMLISNVITLVLSVIITYLITK